MTSDSEKMKEQKDQDELNEEDELIRRDILSDRKFSIAEAIGREGGNFIKGHNPMPRLDQVVSFITVFIADNINDPSRVLMTVLQAHIKNDRIKIAENIETPLQYLHNLIKAYVDNPHQLYELTREADFRWGQINEEKPHFQKPGEAAHPDDEYTHENVKKMLSDLLVKIEAGL
ncbi:MAG: hypothetical protein CVV49_08000 [Spirochaetae bacterium HGW-Spirochaetae-5]|nr:MAG: hypothetical protein CVV49_08000 [Spirochaetae bacterium HGW-Spirochaetae-5]